MIPATVVAAAVLAFVLVGALVRIARRWNVYALPGARQSHLEATPTGGGLGVILALAAASWLGAGEFEAPEPWQAWVVPAALALAVIGWLDDRRPLSPWFRLLVQLAVSFGLLGWLRLDGMALPWPLLLMAGLGLTWTLNMYNFMDGSHGMAGSQGVFAAGLISALAAVEGAWPLAGIAGITAAACAGFLPWNVPRPRIFMGDAGSVPLGFVLGALLLLALRQEVVGLPEAALVLSVFLIDSGWTLLKRVIKQERWYTPHKQHVYQRLIAHGWPHSRVLLLYQAINFGVVVPALMLARTYPDHAWSVAVTMALVMSAAWHAASLKLGDADLSPE